MAAEPWEHRVERLEGAYDRLDGRVDRLESKIDALGVRLDGRIDQLGGRIDQLCVQMIDLRHDQATQFRWAVGLIVISILLPLATHVGAR
ncbi:MAG: hypothetical protein WBA06_14515 [Candidatus Aquilonibacter sp.]